MIDKKDFGYKIYESVDKALNSTFTRLMILSILRVQRQKPGLR